LGRTRTFGDKSAWPSIATEWRTSRDSRFAGNRYAGNPAVVALCHPISRYESEAQSAKGEKEMTIKISLKKIDTIMNDTVDVHFDVDVSEGQTIPLTFTVKREQSLDKTVNEAMTNLRDFAEMLHKAAAEAVFDAGTR
jgi:hypothetical protein